MRPDDQQVRAGDEHDCTDRQRAERASAEHSRQTDDGEADRCRSRDHGRIEVADERAEDRQRGRRGGAVLSARLDGRRRQPEPDDRSADCRKCHRRQPEGQRPAQLGRPMGGDPEQLDREQRADESHREGQGGRQRVRDERSHDQQREETAQGARQPRRPDGEAASRDDAESRREKKHDHGAAGPASSSGCVGVARIPNVLNGQYRSQARPTT